MMRKLAVVSILVLVACTLAAVSFWRGYEAFHAAPLTISSPLRLDMQKGMSMDDMVAQLVSRKATEDTVYWQVLGRSSGLAGKLKAGEFLIPVGTTPPGLLELVASGKVAQYSLTLVEGWNYREVVRAVADHPELKSTMDLGEAQDLLQAIGAIEAHPEGLFLPETYHFPRGTTDVEFLKRAYQAMQHYLESAWANRRGDLPYTSAYEVLIMASIIEKETGLGTERPMIAGVFDRRLKRGMRLQTDPTVIYGLGESFDGNLTRAHLRRDTPYNTYTRHGLTPTPIAMPGRASIEAALNPAPGDALYFVARGDGSHQFSATLEQHNQAVAEYQLRRKK